MARRKRNPDPSKWVKWGVLGAAAYGGYAVYEKIKEGTSSALPRTPRQKCIDDGGIWVPYPTFLPDDGTAGYCTREE